jgi:uncharacterized protein (DUF983 family)
MGNGTRRLRAVSEGDLHLLLQSGSGDPGPNGGEVTFWKTIGRGLKLRCPRCGEGRLFQGFFSMLDACSSCGLDFRRESGYYVGAMYINYGVTAAVELSVGIPLAGRVPLSTLTWPLAVFALVFPLWFFRYSRSLWLGIDLYLTSLAPK